MLKEENLHEYQKTAVDHILKNNFSALFLEMGLGKTVSTLTALNILLYRELENKNALIIAPKRVVEHVWDSEIAKWDHLKHLKISKIIGSQKQRLQALDKNADIYLISRDNIAWLCGLYGGSKLPFEVVVIDESSSFKNPKSVRFKALRKVLPSIKRMVQLTGTPAPNSLLDLWAPMFLLDKGERLGRFITRYREDYFKPKYNGFGYDIREGAEELIYKKIEDICMSMKAEDYLKLPGRITNIISLKMPEKIKEAYLDFEKEKVLELYDQICEEDKEITAVNAAALANKLLQFSNGAVYDDVKNYHVVHDIKIEALKEILEDANGKPVLVAWTYRSDMERIKKALAEYNPTELKNNQTIEDWNAGKIKLLMMHPASGGHGLNLQAGGHIIVWFGQTWSLELEQQFNARLDRQGQENRVIINKLVLEGTMDVEVIKAQERKNRTQEGLMQAVKAKIDKYKKFR